MCAEQREHVTGSDDSSSKLVRCRLCKGMKTADDITQRTENGTIWAVCSDCLLRVKQLDSGSGKLLNMHNIARAAYAYGRADERRSRRIADARAAADAVKATEQLASNAPLPDIEVKVFLVPYGYQLDLHIDLGNGKLEPAGSECRDYGGTYRVDNLRIAACVALANAMRNLEDTMRKPDETSITAQA